MDKVSICAAWRGLPRALVLGSLVMGLGLPVAVADDDLGVTMRMVTDDDVTGVITREIELPDPVNADADGRGSSPGEGKQSQPGNPFMGGGPPGAERNRPDLGPSVIRGNAAENARDRRPDVQRPAPPVRPDKPGRPENPGRPDRPGGGNRP